jgi:hypothetical protein
MKSRNSWRVFDLLFVVGFLMARQATGQSNVVETLAGDEKALLERSARAWIGKLWTSDYSGCEATIMTWRYGFRPWASYTDVELRLNGKLCQFQFFDKDPNKLVIARNDSYLRLISYHGEKLHPPVHITHEQARARVSEFAVLFGVSNLWCKASFEQDGARFDSTRECWIFDFVKVKNGYRCPQGVLVYVSDSPGAPLAQWHNATHCLPDDLPTNVVLTSEQASAKALAYMRKYFPFRAAALYKGEVLDKKEALELKCYTNMLEYIYPNYNYIRPASGGDGFSNYVPKKGEVALAWVNYVGTLENSKYEIGAAIYVDAATGEMLGGLD